MFEQLPTVMAPWYMHIKLVHLLAVMVWMWSAAAAYAFYLVPAFKAWRRNPQDPQVRALRDWTLERFDQVVIYEHIAFPIVLVTGPLLYYVGGFTTSFAWLSLKLLIVVGIFIPLEILDYYLTHFGGNKRRVRETGDKVAYELAVQRHWLFLLLSSPVVMVFGTLVVVLVVLKPL